MDFQDTPEEARFRQEARAWLEANAKRREAAAGLALFEEAGDTPELVKAAKAWQAKKADAGWAGITWPKEYGGRGGSAIEQVIWSQEESQFETPPNIFGIGIGMGGPTIISHGNEEQKKRYLPPMLRGDEIWCQLFSEPGAGSDLAGLRTRAVQEGDKWIVNGQKVWTSGAHYSQWGILVTRHDPNMDKHKGLTYFLVDMKTPGIEIRPIKQMTGGANFNEVFFKDVVIPDANRLGAVGEGWAVAITTLMNERMTIAGGMGMGGNAINEALVALAKEARIDGKSALEHADIRLRLADLLARNKAIEFVGYRLLTALSKGAMPGPEGSIAKLALGILLQEMGAFCMELQGLTGLVFGGEASVANALWQKIYLGSPAIRIAGGADEVQRNIIGERILGLPTEIRVDKGIPFSQIPTAPKA